MPRSPQWSLSLQFPHQDPIHPLSSPIRATCPAHLIPLDFITHTILGDEYKSFSYSLCNLHHSPVTSSLLGPNILLNTMFSNTLRMTCYRVKLKKIIKQLNISLLWVRCCRLMTLGAAYVYSAYWLGYELDDPGFESLRVQDVFLYRKTSRPTLWRTQPLIQ